MVGYWNHSNNTTNNNKVAQFVTPTSHHSMLHRTLIPSSLFSAAPLRPSPPPPPPLRQQQQVVSMEGVEAAALKRGRTNEAAPPYAGEETGFVLPDDAAWAVEEFSVDDLLDFDGLEDSGETFEANAAHPTPPAATATAALPFLPPPLADINLPTHDAEEFEWMSSIIDDTLPEYPAAAAQPKAHLPPPPPPPLESLCRFSTTTHVPIKAKRSKRARSASGAWPRFGGAAAAAAALSDYSAASTTTTTNNNSQSSSCSSSPSYNSHAVILYPPPPPPAPKKRGRKPKAAGYLPHWAAGGEVARGLGERRCTHCGSQKTPQWRTGPMGPKTLCNACGVRYKSGRLVPEYRPAASPTFVSHVHSNSHRKVLEMRRSKAQRHHLAAAAPPVSSF